MPIRIYPFKKICPPLALISLFTAMLLFPEPVLKGAGTGLLLWFNTVLHTQFPFIINCNMLIQTKTVDILLHITSPLFCRFFNVSPYGSFAVLSGFLCGYPMGAKVTADLYRRDKITKTEASYLLSFCNNTSPMFILSFLVMQSLNDNSLKLPILALLFLSPVIISLFTRPKGKNTSARIPAPSACTSYADALDFSIGNALESITKVGVYIMIFAVFTELANMLPGENTLLRLLLLSGLEITNGITLLCQSGLAKETICILCLFETSFGGLCAAAQTASMIKGTGIPVSSYLIKKLATALVTSLLAFLYFYLL